MSKKTKPLIVLWDGDCSFCKNSLEWVQKKNPQGDIQYLSFHEETAKKWREQIGLEALQKSMYVVEENETLYGGSEGFRILLSRIPRYKWLSFLMGLPLIKQCCQFGYSIIANNRMHWGKHSCNIKE